METKRCQSLMRYGTSRPNASVAEGQQQDYVHPIARRGRCFVRAASCQACVRYVVEPGRGIAQKEVHVCSGNIESIAGMLNRPAEAGLVNPYNASERYS